MEEVSTDCNQELHWPRPVLLDLGLRNSCQIWRVHYGAANSLGGFLARCLNYLKSGTHMPHALLCKKNKKGTFLCWLQLTGVLHANEASMHMVLRTLAHEQIQN